MNSAICFAKKIRADLIEAGISVCRRTASRRIIWSDVTKTEAYSSDEEEVPPVWIYSTKTGLMRNGLKLYFRLNLRYNSLLQEKEMSFEPPRSTV